ncbi:Tetratricopeptide repeat-containing protein [Duganella sp. CF402]|nr:tetratricopeptide repeat protein [Duganella sp. BK701]SEK95789.1 Tetratricopeptide repeat-containing protein [Duganella sp. CF402]
MQALKKAERAKQNALSDDELDKPSEAFDEILALTPEPAQAADAVAAPAPAPKREFNLDALSLEPMAGDAPAPVASSAPRPSPDPLPAASDHKEPGMTLDFALDPSDPVNAAQAKPASPAPAASAAAASGLGASAAMAATAAGHGTAAALPADDAGLAPAPSAQATAPRAAAPAASAAKPAAAGNGPHAGAGGKSAAPPAGGDKPRAAARARARAAATAEPTGMDPERLRMIGLIALLVLLVGGFGLYYWRALSGPGAGAGLPPVPMPPPGATGATPAQMVVAALGPGAAPPAAPADSDDPMLAPSGVNRSAQQALEKRIARTEEELAAARSAIQAATAAAAAPRAEQMPTLAAPDSGEIRVARSMQVSPVAPVLDGAYNAFNSGDLPAAQQQYDQALGQDPNNRDALLGAAAVAARQGQKDKAAGFYLRLLELAPNDGAATAGLIGLRQGDISRSEARLKAILATNPDAAPVLFALGNLYAQQGRWGDAQQAYFRAAGAAPDNPDYAYNLAIGLDRLNQPKLAVNYYQRALALAQDKAVGFDRNALRKRLHELGASAGAAAH